MEDEGGDRLKQCKLLINLSNLSNKLVPVSSSYDVYGGGFVLVHEFVHVGLM